MNGRIVGLLSADKSLQMMMDIAPGILDLERQALRSAVVAARRVPSLDLGRDALALKPGARLLAAARDLLARTTSSVYSHVADIEPDKGVFQADCSELIDYLVKKVSPKAFAKLPLDAGHELPRADNYYSAILASPAANTAHAGTLWGRLDKPGDLAPGDVIAWKNEAYVPMKSDTGHVMLVSSAPLPIRQDGQVVGYDVPVIDSTTRGHGPEDDRAPGVRTGLGQGVVYFPTLSNGHATGFDWWPFPVRSPREIRPPSLAFGRLLG